jgi:hypothetical protein
MMVQNDVYSIAYGFFCVGLFVLAINIPLVYYGFQDEDSTCMHGTRGGIDLELWAKLVGFEKIGLTGLVYITSAFAMCGADFVLVGTGICLFLDIFFHIVMWIWGVVILATNENNTCVAEGKDVAIVAIVWLVLSEVSLAFQVMFSKMGK